MKKLLSLSVVAFFLVSFLTSCLGDDADNASQLSYVTLPIDSISMPDTATLGEPVKIIPHVSIKKDCQILQDISYKVTGEKERTIIAVGIQEIGTDCSKAEKIVKSPYFNFQPINEGTYTFKFFKGKKEGTDENVYLDKKIVIKK
ncbi:hypothetical protein KRX57_06265 [Weeksellaceae bacterium TAE3-ERU29]|nr:hypothetical protein [Weeksellaceae bacterium TAE3-ERU29]